MLLPVPSDHGNLENPVNVQGSTTLKKKHFYANNLFHVILAHSKIKHGKGKYNKK